MQGGRAGFTNSWFHGIQRGEKDPTKNLLIQDEPRTSQRLANFSGTSERWRNHSTSGEKGKESREEPERETSGQRSGPFEMPTRRKGKTRGSKGEDGCDEGGEKRV